MPNEEKSAVSKFLEGTENGQENIFKNPTDPFEIKSGEPVEAPKEEEAKEEKPLPFHKDPKIQRYLDKREREMEERFKAAIPAREPAENQTQNEFTSVVESFTAIIGNDTPEKKAALKNLESALGRLDQRAAEKATEKLEQIRANERNEYEKEEREAEETIENAFEKIEDTYGIDITSSRSQKLRTDFLTYVEKIAPKDSDGDIVAYPDMMSAWETFNERRPNTPSRAKELASRSMSRSAETSSAPERRVDWNAVDNMMDTLK